MRCILHLLWLLLFLAAPAHAEYYTAGQPISSGPAVFEFPGGGG